jgi:hypothetical protein
VSRTGSRGGAAGSRRGCQDRVRRGQPALSVGDRRRGAARARRHRHGAAPDTGCDGNRRVRAGERRKLGARAASSAHHAAPLR